MTENNEESSSSGSIYSQIHVLKFICSKIFSNRTTKCWGDGLVMKIWESQCGQRERTSANSELKLWTLGS